MRYLKTGLLGFTGSGKTHTGGLLAGAVAKRFGNGTVHLFDTENSSFQVKRILAANGCKLETVRSRAFRDLMTFSAGAEAGGKGVLMIDSITHVWRELGTSYLTQLNAARAAANKSKLSRLELFHIMKLKDIWQPWPDFFLNAKLHIIICGRAGFEWDTVENEDTGKEELRKVGVKMKVESEFGFEPDVLFEMVREQVEGKRGYQLQNLIRVFKDRYDLANGKEMVNPDAKWFAPWLDAMAEEDADQVNVTAETPLDVDEAGDMAAHRERKQRVALAEEIQGEFTKSLPGMSAADKKARAQLLEKCFGTTSWTRVEGMGSQMLIAGLQKLRSELAAMVPAKAGKEE